LKESDYTLEDASDAISTWDEILAAAQIVHPQVIQGYLTQNSVGAMISGGGAGKSTLTLFEAIHISLGIPCYGRDTIQGKTLFLTAEDGRDMVQHRLGKILLQMISIQYITQEQAMSVVKDIAIADISTKNSRLLFKNFNVMTRTALVEEIIDTYRGFGLVRVVIDPFSLVATGEENSNSEVAEMMRTGAYIAKELNAAVTYVHHEGKGSGGAGQRVDQYSGRGASAFADNARNVVQLIRCHTDRFVSPDGIRFNMPESISDEDMENGRVTALVVHKMSYAELKDRVIFLVRDHWFFTHHEGVRENSDELNRQSSAATEAMHLALLRFIDSNAGMTMTALSQSAAALRLQYPETRWSRNKIVEEVNALLSVHFLMVRTERRGSATKDSDYFNLTAMARDALLDA
jgi:RecA-family ATPase